MTQLALDTDTAPREDALDRARLAHALVCKATRALEQHPDARGLWERRLRAALALRWRWETVALQHGASSADLPRGWTS